MDTFKAQPAILVDYDMYTAEHSVRLWLKARQSNAKLILLVSDPDHHDYDPSADFVEDDVEFDAVLRNHKATRDIAFKTSALCVMQDSLVNPVVALDPDYTVNEMYREGGVLVTLGVEDFEYVR